MNKELLNENLNEILEGLKTVINTANAELPAIFEEIAGWGILQYSVLSIFFLVCILLFVGLTISFIKNDEEPAAIAFFGTVSLMFILLFFYSLLELLFVSIYPKLYIIRYIKDLI